MRSEQLLDVAIDLLGTEGVRAVTHRAVDARAGLPIGSASNYFRSRDALFTAMAERVTVRDLAMLESHLAAEAPATPNEFARVLAAVARDQAGTHRLLTLARYSLLIEGAHRRELSQALLSTGSQVNAYASGWLRQIGSIDPDHDLHVLGNYIVGLVLHQLAIPDPAFDPAGQIEALLHSLIPTVTPAPAAVPAMRA